MSKEQMTISRFDAQYPHLAEWMKGRGWIELGYDGFSSSMIRVLDVGGLIWEGENAYDSVDDALSDAEHAITNWIAKNG